MSFDFIQQKLTQQREHALYRTTKCVESQTAREVKIGGKTYLNFSSNDYLGLNNHAEINKAMQEGADKFGTCASASSLITGYHYAHQSLENDICTWLNKPKCLLFSSGFAANQGVLDALGEKNTNYWLDKLSHASLIDGALASKGRTKRFLHNDMLQLDTLLSSSSDKDNIIVSEGVFSMDGDQANLRSISELANKHKALTYIDDAHSIGVKGLLGEGSLSQAPLDMVMATFGKAIATSGAFVVCNDDIYEYLVNFSRHYIYSTAMSPAIAWATKASIKLIQKEHWRREKITELSHLLSATLNDDIELIKTESSIHAIVLGSASKTLNTSEKLKENGIWVTAIRPPTVANNTSRLRVTITASHNANDIKYLVNSINKAYS
ncbi:aminotransferase class I/II-fold pyridoxal phosphate-dependent enzyme [Colwellia sp. RE-S-Sl-9]